MRAAWPTRLLDLVFPPRCAGCGTRGTVLCTACLASIAPPDTRRCAGCQRPLAAPAVVGLCAPCAAAGTAPLSGLLVAARYDGAARQAIWALKYHGQRRLAAPLGDLLACAAAALPASPDLVAPVPLHLRRQRRRGYNQAELLARRCASNLKLRMRADLLQRVRETPPQVGLGAVARRENVAGAFTVAPGLAPVVAGRQVLLIDDVCTTGATLSAAAQTLRAAGAATVWGLTIAQPALGDDRARPPATARPRPPTR